jgi:hypothetical protein
MSVLFSPFSSCGEAREELVRKLAAILTVTLLGVAGIVPMARAQTPAPAPASGQPASAPPADQSQLLSAGQLDALVSPIALYPDALLSEILQAATYPLEIVEADRWADANKNLKGDALKMAVDKQSWDDSVKSLVATPSVLDMMSQQLSWTQQLGDAVLAQQPDVMDAIQRLRAKAQANNTLSSNQQQTVTTQQQPGGGQAIVIAPTNPDVMYVPYYDPSVAYGAWPYPAYPPYYWPAPGYIAGGLLATGLAFGAGYALGRWAGGGYWGGGFNWGGNNITVNRNTNINNINRGGGGNWAHNPAHRQGVRYNNASVANRFGGNTAGAGNRMDFRGRGGNQVLQPGSGNRPNAGAGAGGNRPNAGAGANRPSTGGGNRANVGGGGNRANVGGGNRAGGGRPGGGGVANIGSGRSASLDAGRGRASLGGGGGRGGGGGGGGRVAGGGGGRGGGGGGGGGRGGGGGGRRSDMLLKHDIVMLGRLDNGLGYYRFVYNGGHTAYVGVLAQEVRTVMPEAVTRGADGYMRVSYDLLGLPFETYDQWIATGAHLPSVNMVAH